MLVSGFTGNAGDDLDADDDGVSDAAVPWSSVIDSFGIVDGDANTDFQYGGGALIVGPDGNFAPAHAFRDVDGTGTFQIGSFDDRSADTPGSSNGSAIPEPSSVAFLGTAIALGAMRRRRRNA